MTETVVFDLRAEAHRLRQGHPPSPTLVSLLESAAHFHEWRLDENRRFREALEFYADAKNWALPPPSAGVKERYTNTEKDMGKRAKDALEDHT